MSGVGEYLDEGEREDVDEDNSLGLEKNESEKWELKLKDKCGFVSDAVRRSSLRFVIIFTIAFFFFGFLNFLI